MGKTAARNSKQYDYSGLDDDILKPLPAKTLTEILGKVDEHVSKTQEVIESIALSYLTFE